MSLKDKKETSSIKLKKIEGPRELKNLVIECCNCQILWSEENY